MSDRIISVERLSEGWKSLLNLRIEAHGETYERTLVEHPSGAQVLAYDAARRVALVGTQTRIAALYLNAAPFLEALGGIGHEDDAEECARQEALEEAGVRLRDLEFVGQVWMTPSSSTERVYLFLAEYEPEDRIAAGGGLAEEQEYIEIEERPLAELWQAMESGAMTDAKLYMLLHALRFRRPELFA